MPPQSMHPAQMTAHAMQPPLTFPQGLAPILPHMNPSLGHPGGQPVWGFPGPGPATFAPPMNPVRDAFISLLNMLIHRRAPHLSILANRVKWASVFKRRIQCVRYTETPCVCATCSFLTESNESSNLSRGSDASKRKLLCLQAFTC